jgi:glutamyl-tRNA synthetase
MARASSDGRTVLRVEDIDPPRVVKEASSRIIDDLTWLGFDWDEGPFFQSTRTSIYEAALSRLEAAGLTYPCDCSRAEIARAASAPHAGEEGSETVYPGTCRNAPRIRDFKRPPAIRLRVPEGSCITFDDAVCGRVEEDVGKVAGDFVLRRGDDVFAYQLVVSIDDAEMAVSHVVRADDLLSSTGRQILLMRLLGYESIPSYAHVPLVVAPGGDRLAKRTRGATVRELAERGVSATTIIGTLARGLGLVPPARTGPLSPRDVAASLTSPSTWRRLPWPMPAEWA